MPVLGATLFEGHHQAGGENLMGRRGGGRHVKNSIDQLAPRAVIGKSVKIVDCPAVRGRGVAHVGEHSGLHSGSLYPSVNPTGRSGGVEVASPAGTGQDMPL
jgi:hypothetical protein